MNNHYVHRLGLTAWRKKSALLLTLGLISIVIFGMQFTRINEKSTFKTDASDSPRIIAESLIQKNNVKFVESHEITKPIQVNSVKTISNAEVEELSKLEQPTRDEIARKKSEELEMEQQLGIPFVDLDPIRPYIPKKRIIHLDLKGAPPLPAFFKKLFPLIKNLGATGILLEYEDMFPYSGILKNIAAKNAYTPAQIKEIQTLADTSKLEIIPLIQTFGHLEFALKTSDWSQLREVANSPQALCPSRNRSLDFIREMVSQVMALHPTTKYLHIGCDEVFQMGECALCRLELRDQLFIRHVQNVVGIIRAHFPHLRVIIWDDMLRRLPQESMLGARLGQLVEPMVWVYAEDVYRFVQPQVWAKYAAVFRTAWAASAFKGAFGETLAVPDARRHLENNLRWLQVMGEQHKSFKAGLTGLAITGWQRYDHFAVLCELLPAGLPSLVLSLLAVSKGYFNSTLRHEFLSALSCPDGTTQPFINLDADPHMWNKLGRCMFPGSAFFRVTYRLQALEKEYEDFLHTTTKEKGWLTDYNIRRNYSLPLRVDELIGDIPRIQHGFTALIRSAVDAMIDIFDNYTIGEWIEQKIYTHIIRLETLRNQSIALKSVNHWPVRPLPPLKDMERFGVPIPYN